MEQLCFMTNVSAESWMQFGGAAVGALVAVLVVFLQHWLEKRRVRRATHERRLDQFDALIEVSRQVKGKIDWLIVRLELVDDHPEHFPLKTGAEYKEEFAGIAETLREFRLDNLPAYLLIGDVSRLRSIVEEVPRVAGELSGLMLLKHTDIARQWARLHLAQEDAHRTMIGILESRKAEVTTYHYCGRIRFRKRIALRIKSLRKALHLNESPGTLKNPS